MLFMARLWQKMAIFSWNFGLFDIFNGLWPYLCFKRYELGFHKQATHRRRDDEPFFTLGSTVHDWGWPKNGQTGQACQRSKVVQKGLLALSVTKYSKRESRKRFSCDLKYGESACSYYNNNKKAILVLTRK